MSADWWKFALIFGTFLGVALGLVVLVCDWASRG